MSCDGLIGDETSNNLADFNATTSIFLTLEMVKISFVKFKFI